MATRLLIFDRTGRPLIAMDGHDGGAHAARWLAAVLATLPPDAIALEWTPAAGGDRCRDIISHPSRLALEWRQIPDGRRELVGLVRRASRAVDDLGPVLPGQSITARQHVALAEPVHGGLRLLTGPADIANAREPMRRARSRLDPSPASP